MLYKVTSVAFDPDARNAYYTEDNHAFRDLMEVDVDTGRKRMLLRDARIGDLVVNPADKSIWGIRHQNGFATIVRIPPPYAGFNQIHTFKYGEIPFDLDISPDGSMISAIYRRNQRHPIGAGVETTACRRTAIPTRSPGSTCRRQLRKASSSRRTGSRCTAPAITPAYRTSSASTSQPRNMTCVSNASTGFFRPMPQPDGSLVVYEFTGEGLQPVRFTPEGPEDLGTVEFLGTNVVNDAPSSSNGAWARRPRSTSMR